MNAQVNAVALQSDGSIIIGGVFTTGGTNISALRVARLSSTGLIDTNFTGNVNNTVSALDIQPDGKIVIGGTFTGVQ